MDDCWKDIAVTYYDNLNMDGFLEPYRRWYGRDNKSKVLAYHKKPEYEVFTPIELDPLRRFTYDTMTKEEVLFRGWFLDDDASHQGLFMEAALSCHLIKNEKCHSCKYKNALRWNGGGQSSWQDLYCTVCFSTYEVKTKATTERVENAFKWNRIHGGSYYEWCKLNNRKPHPEQKRFLVLLPRMATYNRKRDKGKSVIASRFFDRDSPLTKQNSVYPVHIAEISAVVPKLHPSSFNALATTITFKTNVSVKMSTKEKWLDLPSTGEYVETWDIAEKVYIERFSQELFDAFTAKYFESDESTASKTSEDVDPNEFRKQEMEDVVEQLSKLEVPDDWEDLVSDED